MPTITKLTVRANQDTHDRADKTDKTDKSDKTDKTDKSDKLDKNRKVGMDDNVHASNPSTVCSTLKTGQLESDLEAWQNCNKEMFVRVLTGSQAKPKIAMKFLVDTGNLGRSLISERLAQTLGLQLHPTSLTIKAAQGSKIQIKGETNSIKFYIEQCPTTFNWQFLVIKDLCAPGVFGTDFLNLNNVGVQLTSFGQNHLTFMGKPDLTVPLVTPRASNLPHPLADSRFKGAGIFRQQPNKAAGQLSSALRDEAPGNTEATD